MSTQPADGDGGNAITDRQLFDQATAPDPTPTRRRRRRNRRKARQITGEATDAPPPSTRPDLQPQQPAATDRASSRETPDGKFAPKGQPQPQQRQPEDHRVPLREMLDERERRQRIEAEYNQLLQHIQQQQKPQGPETIFDAPDEYLNSTGDRSAAARDADGDDASNRCAKPGICQRAIRRAGG